MTFHFKLILKQLFYISLFLLTCWSSGSVQAQVLTGIATQWNDSFAEWDIYSAEEDIQGTLFLRWITRKDWTEWQFRMGDQFGTIKQKWSNDPSQWEIRSGNEIVSMRTVWSKDFRKWRITGPKSTYDFECRYGNIWDEWQLKNGDDHFFVYTNWEGDPRDWIIEDELGDSYSFTEKMAMVFLAIYNSSPRE